MAAPRLLAALTAPALIGGGLFLTGPAQLTSASAASVPLLTPAPATPASGGIPVTPSPSARSATPAPSATRTPRPSAPAAPPVVAAPRSWSAELSGAWASPLSSCAARSHVVTVTPELYSCAYTFRTAQRGTITVSGSVPSGSPCYAIAAGGPDDQSQALASHCGSTNLVSATVASGTYTVFLNGAGDVSSFEATLTWSAESATCTASPWTGAVNVEGRPAGLDPGDRDGVYLWHDRTAWHLRATDVHDTRHRYTGTLTLSSGRFTSVSTVRLESIDHVTLQGDATLTYSFATYNGIDGIDFEVSGCGDAAQSQALHLALDSEGKADPDHIFVGANEHHPASAELTFTRSLV